MRKLGSYLWQAKRGSCAVFFCGTVILALALLVVSAFFPQTLITRHVLDSWEAVSLDNRHPTVADYSPASRLDTGTDAMMLRASMSTRDDYLGSVLTNPIYTYGENGNDWDSIPDTVAQQAMGMPHSGVFYYSRYWMGFRVLLRFALTFLTYGQIKRYLAFAFLTLFVYTMIQIGKHGGSRLGFLFALSVILVRPHVMATSAVYLLLLYRVFCYANDPVASTECAIRNDLLHGSGDDHHVPGLLHGSLDNFWLPDGLSVCSAGEEWGKTFCPSGTEETFCLGCRVCLDVDSQTDAHHCSYFCKFFV